ncbi:phosphoadenosine phosphosulfate reductase family protein, partial [Clostridioides difficile]
MNLLEKEDLARTKAEELEHASPEDIIRYAIETFPNITFACSFGAEDVVLVDMVQKISPSTDIFYLDTDFHFKETYETRDKMQENYNLEFVRVSPKITPEEQAAQHGEELWKSDPNGCCNIRKVEPLTRILSQYDAWITG